MESKSFVPILFLLLNLCLCPVSGTTAGSFCSSIDGLWSNTTQSCFKHYQIPRMGWSPSMADCAARAPTGLVGRLAHIPSEKVWNLLNSVAGYRGWIGLKAYVDGSPDLYRDWYFYNDETTVAGCIEWVVPDFNTADTADNCMLLYRPAEGPKLIDGRCETAYSNALYDGAICEFIASELISAASLPLNCVQPAYDVTVSSAEELCSYIDGLWSDSTQSCFKHYQYPQISWSKSMADCLARAPPGSGLTGRLAHIQSEEVWNLVTSVAGYRGWIGLKAYVDGSPDLYRDWYFYNDETTVAGCVEWLIQDFNTADTSDNCMLLYRPTEGPKLIDGRCDTSYTNSLYDGAICEFIASELTSEASLPLNCLQPAYDVIVSSAEELCSYIDGIWSASTQSCFKHYQHPQISWGKSMVDCLARVPPGSGLMGRLAHIPSEEVWNLVTSVAGYRGWIGLKAYVDGSPDLYRDWYFYNDETTVAGCVEWLIQDFNTADTSDNCMLLYRPAEGPKLIDGRCDTSYTNSLYDGAICEFIASELTSAASLPLSCVQPAYDVTVSSTEELCSYIDGIWSDTTQSCFKHYQYPQISWGNSMVDCLARAPPSSGIMGRLAHIPSEEVWNLVTSVAGYRGWIGLKAYVDGSPDLYRDWYFYNDETTVGSCIEWMVPDFNTADTSDNCMLLYRPAEGPKLIDGRCDTSYTNSLYDGAICEFIAKHESAASVNDLCNSINGIWSETTQSCFKHYQYPQIGWTNSMTDCIARAPSGIVGRLAHIPSEVVWNLITSTPGYRGWIGLKATVPGSADLYNDWHFYNNETSIAGGIEWVVPDFSTTDTLDNCMLLYIPTAGPKLIDGRCETSYTNSLYDGAICEYIGKFAADTSTFFVTSILTKIATVSPSSSTTSSFHLSSMSSTFTTSRQLTSTGERTTFESPSSSTTSPFVSSISSSFTTSPQITTTGTQTASMSPSTSPFASPMTSLFTVSPQLSSTGVNNASVSLSSSTTSPFASFMSSSFTTSPHPSSTPTKSATVSPSSSTTSPFASSMTPSFTTSPQLITTGTQTASVSPSTSPFAPSMTSSFTASRQLSSTATKTTSVSVSSSTSSPFVSFMSSSFTTSPHPSSTATKTTSVSVSSSTSSPFVSFMSSSFTTSPHPSSTATKTATISPSSSTTSPFASSMNSSFATSPQLTTAITSAYVTTSDFQSSSSSVPTPSQFSTLRSSHSPSPVSATIIDILRSSITRISSSFSSLSPLISKLPSTTLLARPTGSLTTAMSSNSYSSTPSSALLLSTHLPTSISPTSVMSTTTTSLPLSSPIPYTTSSFPISTTLSSPFSTSVMPTPWRTKSVSLSTSEPISVESTPATAKGVSPYMSSMSPGTTMKQYTSTSPSSLPSTMSPSLLPPLTSTHVPHVSTTQSSISVVLPVSSTGESTVTSTLVPSMTSTPVPHVSSVPLSISSTTALPVSSRSPLVTSTDVSNLAVLSSTVTILPSTVHSSLFTYSVTTTPSHLLSSSLVSSDSQLSYTSPTQSSSSSRAPTSRLFTSTVSTMTSTYYSSATAYSTLSTTIPFSSSPISQTLSSSDSTASLSPLLKSVMHTTSTNLSTSSEVFHTMSMIFRTTSASESSPQTPSISPITTMGQHTTSEASPSVSITNLVTSKTPLMSHVLSTAQSPKHETTSTLASVATSTSKYGLPTTSTAIMSTNSASILNVVTSTLPTSVTTKPSSSTYSLPVSLAKMTSPSPSPSTSTTIFGSNQLSSKASDFTLEKMFSPSTSTEESSVDILATSASAFLSSYIASTSKPNTKLTTVGTLAGYKSFSSTGFEFMAANNFSLFFTEPKSKLIESTVATIISSKSVPVGSKVTESSSSVTNRLPSNEYTLTPKPHILSSQKLRTPMPSTFSTSVPMVGAQMGASVFSTLNVSPTLKSVVSSGSATTGRTDLLESPSASLLVRPSTKQTSHVNFTPHHKSTVPLFPWIKTSVSQLQQRASGFSLHSEPKTSKMTAPPSSAMLPVLFSTRGESTNTHNTEPSMLIVLGTGSTAKQTMEGLPKKREQNTAVLPYKIPSTTSVVATGNHGDLTGPSSHLHKDNETVTIIPSTNAQFLSRRMPTTTEKQELCHSCTTCQYTWQNWKPCSASCGIGKRSRHAASLSPSEDIICEKRQETQVCQNKVCPVDCNFSWNSWGICTKSCDGGIQWRTPWIKVKAAHGGKVCPGAEKAGCNVVTCPPQPTDLTSTVGETTTKLTTTSTTKLITTTPVFPLSEVEEVVVEVLQTLGCSFILGSLGLTLAVFLLLRDFSYERFLHMNQEIALLLGHVLVLMMRDKTENTVACKFASMGLQFFFTASFAFMALEALQAYAILTSIITSKGYFSRLQFFTIGWGLSATVSICTAMMAHNRMVSYWSCWLNIGDSIAIASLLPIAFFSATAIVTVEASSMGKFPELPRTDKNQRTAAMANQKGLLIILPMNVVAWFFGAFAVYYANLAMFSLVSALNLSLGISIFVFHSLGNPKVHALFKKLIAKLKQ